MLVGVAVGVLAATATAVLVSARVRPDVVIALVVGLPSAIGLMTILLSRRRWLTAVGVFTLALAPGWFGVLALIEVTSHA
jgi:hypothetical protein